MKLTEEVIRSAIAELKKKMIDDPRFNPSEKGIYFSGNYSAKELYENEILPRTDIGMEFIKLYLGDKEEK